jgi:flagellar FliL protein
LIFGSATARQKGIIDHDCPAIFSQSRGRGKVPLTIVALASQAEGAGCAGGIVSRRNACSAASLRIPFFAERTMADNDQSDGGAPEAAGPRPAKKRRRWLVIALAVVVLAAAGGGGYFFLFKHGDGARQAQARPVPPPVFVEVPEVLVNLAGAAGERVQYLKIKAVLEVKDAPQGEKVKPLLPRIVDLFQTYLRELRPSDLHGSMGLFRLKEELTRRVNVATAPGQVSAVLFKEVVVQ